MPTRTSHAKAAVLAPGQHPVVFWVLFATVSAFVILYVWLIQATIYSVVERKSLSTENTGLSQSIAPLESRYLALSRDITLERAHELGFVDVPRVEYAGAGQVKTVLSRN